MGKGRVAASILGLGSARERACDDILSAVRVGELLRGYISALMARERSRVTTVTKYGAGRTGKQMPAHPRTAKEQRVEPPTTM